MAERRGKSVRLGDALGDLVRTADRSGGLSRARASEVWDEVVGPEIARHTVSLAMRRGELLVHVDSHAWAAQLGLLAEDLSDRINSVLGETLVGSIRFTVSREVRDRRQQEREEDDARTGYGGERVEPSPLTEEEMDAVEASVAAIGSDSLRQAALEATKRDLEVKKGRERGNDR